MQPYFANGVHCDAPFVRTSCRSVGLSISATLAGDWTRAAGTRPQHEADAALIRSADDLATATQLGFKSAIAIGAFDSSLESVPNVVTLSDKYNYISDGDLLGYQPGSRRFRTLFRRSSAHNSFLVTERCNHYCLMCSQPPRDIDDRWVLDEIEEAIPLVDPQTKSFAFTGGEPLLEWQRFIQILGQCRDRLPEHCHPCPHKRSGIRR